MSTAQILREVPSLSTPELQLLAVSLQFERLKRVGKTASQEELRWLEIINQALPGAGRLEELTKKWEEGTLCEEEKSELRVILSEREAQNAARADAIQHLSELTGLPFLTLWKQLINESSQTLVPHN